MAYTWKLPSTLESKTKHKRGGALRDDTNNGCVVD